MSQNTIDENKNLNENNIYDELKSWEDLNINLNILRGIYAYGFETPSSIQKKAILPLIDGKDNIAQL